MTVQTFTQPDSSTQTGSGYKNPIDRSVAVMAEVARAFAPHENNPLGLTAVVDAGRGFIQGAIVSQTSQTVSGFTATGANQRIDRIVLDALTLAATRVAGTESASPVAPAIPNGKLPCAQVGPFTTSTTQITNAMITDERSVIMPAVGKQTVWVPAAAMLARTTSGAAGPAVVELATNKIMVRAFDFDAAADEFVQFAIKMPKGWNEGTVTARFAWTAASGSGAVIWGLQALAVSDDDPLDAAFGTAQTVTDTLLAANDQHLSAETAAITIAGSPAEHDLVIFQAYRDADAGGDTLAVDAKLLGVELLFTTNAVDDT